MKKIIALALVAIMMISISSVAFAADEFKSPTGDSFYSVAVKVKDDKGGTATSGKVTVISGETTVIKAKADDGYTFGGWTFTGDFEWVSGDANSETIEVRAFSDLVFTAVFNGEGGASKDPGATSPETGYGNITVAVIMAVAVFAAAGAVVYTGKKYFEA